MQRIQTLLFFLFCIIATKLSAESHKVQAIFSHSTFLMAGKTPYVETYLMVRGSSVVFKKTENNKFQGTIEVILTVKEGEKIRYIDKYNLLSPESSDSLNVGFNFIDQQRIQLSPGKFNFNISIRDINTSAEPVEAIDSLTVNFPVAGTCISDIEIIDSYKKADKPGSLTKGGYDLVPHISGLFLEDESKLVFYSEIYHTLSQLGEGEKFVANYFLTKQDSTPLPDYSGFRKFTSAEVNVLMAELDIKTLISGNYFLKIEVRNKENHLLAERYIVFYRNNPRKEIPLDDINTVSTEGSFVTNYVNIDSISEHIRCLAPISSEREKIYANNLLRTRDLQMMQRYFLTFWQNRSLSQPQTSWETYFVEVRKAQREFSTSIRKGYNTDRGRVYLQYGAPDNRSVSLREPTAYPYEIWQYYKIRKQSNRRFVFYNPDLVTNDFTLIHSDALGEIMNDNWQMLILKRDSQTNDIDNTQSPSHFGSQLQQNYQTPTPR